MSIDTLLKALTVMLKPIVRLMLRGGVGYSEFSYVAKCVFVDVATLEYGLRSRPTNMSRVSAITGISRKQVGQLRREGPEPRWTPHMEGNPLNTILDFWHHDPEFSVAKGRPKPLRIGGQGVSLNSSVDTAETFQLVPFVRLSFEQAAHRKTSMLDSWLEQATIFRRNSTMISSEASLSHSVTSAARLFITPNSARTTLWIRPSKSQKAGLSARSGPNIYLKPTYPDLRHGSGSGTRLC